MQSPWKVCQAIPDGESCRTVFAALKNPYYIGDEVALTQTTGWADAWISHPSVYAVAAQQPKDVVAAVNFARQNNLRLVIKGGGHSYLGTSNAPDSLLVWTRPMNNITLHEAFVAQGCGAAQAPQPAVTVGAGAIWMHTYNQVTTHGGRYVQGGGCATVGVAGLIQGGGFGSYSKNYGIAAASLLEAQIVTADGSIRLANACTNPDLFWALKGGGGGTFGVVTRMTLRTHDLPAAFGFVSMTVQASSAAAYRRLLGQFVSLYTESLHNRHWGEIVNVRPDNKLEIQMSFQGLDKTQAESIWQPFLKWVNDAQSDFTLTLPPTVQVVPAEHRWDAAYIKARAPAAILSDDRPGASPDNVFWSANVSEAGHFIRGFESIWLPASLLHTGAQPRLTEALLASSRHSKVELHFQKGLAGASEEAKASARDTSMNPAVLDAFALAIIGSEAPPAYPGVHGHEPDLAAAARDAREIVNAMNDLREIAPDAGSYVAESSYFEREWQKSYWGLHYSRLFDIKQKYDPTGLFFVHHGVGSEEWSADGFTRVMRA